MCFLAPTERLVVFEEVGRLVGVARPFVDDDVSLGGGRSPVKRLLLPDRLLKVELVVLRSNVVRV